MSETHTDYPAEWSVNSPREQSRAMSAARGLGTVLVIALGYVAAVLGYAATRWWMS